MEKKTDAEKLEKLLKSREKQYKRQNNFVKNNYDRVAVLLPHGVKDRIKNSGLSINSFINSAILEKLEKDNL